MDASFYVGEQSGGCGAIVRDNRGNFIGAATAKLTHVADVVCAEAAALREGLKFLQNLGCNNVLVRMDNIIITDAIKENEAKAWWRHLFWRSA